MIHHLIEESIEFCKEYLLHQGPLEYFVHHNTIHAFEEYNFYDGLKYSSSLYFAKSYKSIYWYQKRFRSGRITTEDLAWGIRRFFPAHKINLQEKHIDTHSLLYSLLFLETTRENIRFNVYEQKLISHLKLKERPVPDKYKRVFDHYDFLIRLQRHADLPNEVEIFLSRFFAAYFDKGVAYWQMEKRETGILQSFAMLADDPLATGWKRHLHQLLKKYHNHPHESKDIVADVIEELGIDDLIITNYLFQTLFRLKGWSALALALESNQSNNPTGILSDFEEFVAVILLVDLAVFRHFSKELIAGSFGFRLIEDENCLNDNIYSHLFRYLEKQGIDLRQLSHSKDVVKLEQFMTQIDEFTLFQIWHEAYEMNLMSRAYGNLELAARHAKPQPKEIKYQVVACIDDREESLRRILEELSENVETFGYAGHFGLNITYKAHNRVHFRPLCPVVVIPDFYVWEEDLAAGKFTRIWGHFKLWFFHHSKTGVDAVIISLLAGVFSLFRMVLDVFLPTTSFSFRQFLSRVFLGESKTRLNFLNVDRNNGLKGYELEDMVKVVGNLLRTTGLTKNFARFVYIVGHGSSSVNNPHEAAYDCGACSGGRGIPNARIFASIANRTDVRDSLAKQGIKIPAATVFIGGYHNTGNDDLLIYDISEDLAKSEDFIEFRQLLDNVREFDAKERLRKFENVSLNSSPTAAFNQAQARIVTFSQPRPEYGHATNAIAIVGPRDKSKDVFFDRRAFLVSYDPKQDKDKSVLASLINVVVPVCAGISLEYYFSYVDREVYGAGVKQPHNVTGLMGVVNGYGGDLRLGLAFQMVEIHEPVRITIFVYAEVKDVLELVKKSVQSFNLVMNEWVRMAVIDSKNKAYLFMDGEFVPMNIPQDRSRMISSSSMHLIKGKRGLLDFAVLGGEK